MNNTKNLATGIIAILVSLVAIVGVFVPIVSGLQDNIVSTTNNETVRFMVAENRDLTVEFDGSNFTINGTSYSGSRELMVISDTIIVRMNSEMNIFDRVNGLAATSSAIQFKNGTFSYTTADNFVHTGEYEELLYPHPRGNYGCYYQESFIPFNADLNDPIYAINVFYGNANAFVAEIKNGALEEFLFPVSVATGGNLTPDTTEVTINIQSDISDDELSRSYSAISATIGSTNTQLNVYAPIHYSILDENAQAARTIVSTIPLILIIALLVMAAGLLMIYTKNKNQI